MDLNFKKIFNGRKKKSHPIFGNDPRTDWEKMIITFAIINLLIILWSAYIFWQIDQGEIFQVASAPTVGADAATRNNLKNILNIYGAKEKQFENLRVAKPITNDPAL